MQKTTVYLSEAEAETLRRLAARTGKSQSELLREGVRLVGADLGAPSRTFHSMGVGKSEARRPRGWTSDELHRKAMGH